MRKVNCLYLKLRIILLPKSICSNERCIRGSSSALGIVDHLGKKVKKLIFTMNKCGGYDHETSRQIMGLELLLREDIPLVTLTGKAGTGKTLLALASGLMQTEDLGLYKNYLWQDQLFQSEKISVIYQEKRRKIKTMDATNF